MKTLWRLLCACFLLAASLCLLFCTVAELPALKQKRYVNCSDASDLDALL